jgi:hypothetical protein
MKAPRLAFIRIVGLGLLAAPLAAVAQPTLENFRFDPPRVCARDTLRWGVSYRGLPGGLAAAKEVSMEGLWEGAGERPMRSLLTPAQDDLQPYTAEQGRFESRILHAGPARRGRPGDAEIRYTLRIVLADGQEVTTATSVRYVDGWSAARASHDARGRAHRPHRPRDHHADDPGVPERDQARYHKPDLGRPRATAGGG